MTKSISLSELANKLGATLDLRGKPDIQIQGIAPLDHAQSMQLSFFTNDKYLTQLKNTHAAAVMVKAEHASESLVPTLAMANPYLGFAKVAAFFDQTPVAKAGTAKTAIIDPSAHIPESVSIGHHVVIGAGVTLGERVVIGHGCIIDAGVVIGDDTVLKPSVTLYHHISIGQRCTLHSGVVIGSDGFGNAQDQGKWIKIPQLGSVIIEDDVEIGANTTVDRGALGNTHIKQGVKLDNLIQVGHNVVIGEHTAIAAGVGIAGSVTIGKYCMIGGACGIAGHLHIVDKVYLAGMTGVSKSIDKPGFYGSAIPAREGKEWARGLAYFNRMGKYVERIQLLEQHVKQLEKGI